MKKLGFPDSADVNTHTPPTPIYSGSEHNCLIFGKKERRQKMPAEPFSPALLSYKALDLSWGPALTPWALAGGTRWTT